MSIKVRMESIGRYLPEKIVSTAEMTGRMKKPPRFDLVKITGIENRRYRSDTDSSVSFALDAARDCLKSSKYKPEELEAVIFTAITRFKDHENYYYEPAISHLIKSELGCKNAINFDITNACAGMNTGVYALSELIKAGVVKNGIVLSGEIITVIADCAVVEISKPIDKQFAALTVGDAGVATILDISPNETEQIDFIEFTTIPKYAKLRIGIPSDQDNRIAMYTKAKKIHDETKSRLIPFSLEVLKKHNVDLDDYDYAILHQTSIGSVKGAWKQIYRKFGKESATAEVPIVCNKYGNTASTSHYVVLKELIENGQLKPNSKVLLVVGASGIIIGLVSYTLGDLTKGGN